VYRELSGHHIVRPISQLEDRWIVGMIYGCFAK
ncbi:uncharacterized protein METZ01_LOCUS301709, partial [marine metagenome]